MIDVSVIIPVYNSSKFVAQSIDSALAQREVSLEVIVVDDGSTDGTSEVLASYGEKIRCLRQQNNGAYVARNRAAESANGEWLAFLDADDTWSENKLAKQLKLATDGVDLIYSDCANLDETGRVASYASEVSSLPEKEIFNELLVSNFIATSTVIIRRSTFERLGGFTTTIKGCADWDLWLRCAASGCNIRVHPDPLTTYRWHEGQMSKSFGARQQDRLKVIQRAIDFARRLKRDVPRSLEKKAFGQSWATAAWFVAPQSRLTAAYWCLRAILWQPFQFKYYKLLLKSLLGRN